MLNSGAVLQQRTLPYLKMPSGQCQHLKLILTADLWLAVFLCNLTFVFCILPKNTLN